MKVVFEHKNPVPPKLSIILLDWSCRESFHMLNYLASQTVPREQYEVIWIEYYTRHSPELTQELERCKESGESPVIDKWIVLGISDDNYYHKHLMYNIGIVAGAGEIITICDSDAFVQPTFVESILEEFRQDSNIVLHMDEVRNVNRHFYPFNYPDFSEITGDGCINFVNGKTKGLWDQTDPLHLRNYGACMCALRKDLIEIGGADEHLGYLGHICGPYEMTFRLVNAGRREIWHQGEFLYHTWHPGTDGHANYLGPHDGMNMSTIALDAIQSGRVLPLIENPAIRILRTRSDAVLYDSLLSQAIPELELARWKPQYLKGGSGSRRVRIKDICRSIKNHPAYFFSHLAMRLALWWTIAWMTIRHVCRKLVARLTSHRRSIQTGMPSRLLRPSTFFMRMLKNNIYTVQLCRQTVGRLASAGVREIAIYGTGFIAKVLRTVTRQAGMRVTGPLADNTAQATEHRRHNRPPREQTCPGRKVVIAALSDLPEKTLELEDMGYDRSNIVTLQ